MSDESEHDLTPPEERLDERTRSRIRSRVVDGVRDDQAGPGGAARRWLAPAGAAAAVLVVVAAAWGIGQAASRTQSSTVNGPEAGAHPDAGASDAAATMSDPACGLLGTEATPSTGRTLRETVGTSPAPLCGGGASSDSPTPAVPALVTACRRASDLRGADVSLVSPSQDGALVFLTAGTRWQLCSVHPDASRPDGLTVTLHEPQPLAAVSVPDSVEPYRVSNDNLARNGGGYAAEFAAGGPLPTAEHDDDIVYTFPGGQRERAEVQEGSDGRWWWALDHVADSGPLADPDVNQTSLPRIGVDVTQPGGLHVSFELDWGVDTCAQSNHGC